MRSDSVNYGRNSDRETDRYVRCARCGFPVNLDQRLASSDGSRVGWGTTMTAYPVCETRYDDPNTNYADGVEDYDSKVEYDQGGRAYDSGNDSSKTLNYDGIAKTIYDPEVVGGCPQCGTMLYNQ